MKYNIIMVLLDGARWDRLKNNNTFKKLQQKGTTLNNVITAIPYTFGSINVIFTGLFGKENGVDAYYKMFRLKDEVQFLPEILKKNGYYTSCDLISEKVISSRGFDKYQSHNEFEDNLLDKHSEFLKKCFIEAGDKPIFSFLQFSRIHTVTVSEILKKYEWDDEQFYEKKYDNLKKLDDVINESCNYAEKIYQTIKNLGKIENTILVFFSDHGTGVGERFGERNYGVFTFEETIRTFYLFMSPEITENRESEKLRSTIDIFPTILDLAEINYKKDGKGDSLSLFLKGRKELQDKDYVFSETGGLQGPFPSPKKPNVFSIKTPRYKLIFFQALDKWDFYDLEKDPNEEENIIGKEPDIEINLKKKLLDWINR